MKRTLTLFLIGTMILSVVGGAYAYQDADASMAVDEQLTGDTVEVTVESNSSGNNYYVAAYNNESDKDNATNALNTSTTFTADGSVNDVTMDISNRTDDGLVFALRNDADDSIITTDGTAEVNATTTLHDVSVTFDNQNFTGDEAEVSYDVANGSGDYHVVIHEVDENGSAISDQIAGTASLNASENSVTVTLDGDAAPSDGYTNDTTLSAMLHVDDGSGGAGDAIVGANDNADLTIAASGGGDDGGNDLPLIGDLPVLGGLPTIGIGIIVLLIAGLLGGGYYYTQMMPEEEQTIID